MTTFTSRGVDPRGHGKYELALSVNKEVHCNANVFGLSYLPRQDVCEHRVCLDTAFIISVKHCLQQIINYSCLVVTTITKEDILCDLRSKSP